MPCPAVLAAAAEGGTRLAHDPASASEAAMASTAVGAAGGSAGDRTAATEAAGVAASAAVGPKDATGVKLASALAGEAALGLPAACASTGPWSCRAGGMFWLRRGMPWGMAMLDRGVIAESHKSGVIMTSLP